MWLGRGMLIGIFCNNKDEEISIPSTSQKLTVIRIVSIGIRPMDYSEQW
jgi:hypothetical protein